MINAKKRKLFDIMESVGNHMFYSYVPKADDPANEDINSRKILNLIDDLAKEFSGIQHYYHEQIVEHKQGTTIKITYIFEDHTDNLLFRNSLFDKKIPFHTTGLKSSTYLELSILES